MENNNNNNKITQQFLCKSTSLEHYKSRLWREPHHTETDSHQCQQVPCDGSLTSATENTIRSIPRSTIQEHGLAAW